LENIKFQNPGGQDPSSVCTPKYLCSSKIVLTRVTQLRRLYEDDHTTIFQLYFKNIA